MESSLAISLDGVPGWPLESVVWFPGAPSEGGISDGAGPLFAGLVKLLGGLRFTPPLEVGVPGEAFVLVAGTGWGPLEVCFLGRPIWPVAGTGFLPPSSLPGDLPDI